ncbi:hypothetical protein ACQPZQ_14770 [Pseudonocardia sp. CA-142604]|uniref:hypothetical protein n=1 Tax=Pseudonocardia sp. CA-142604 TaxID=3240024 RepID=UPI003D90B9B4
MIVEVQWLGVAAIESLSWPDARVRKYFNVKPHPKVSEQFNVPIRDRIVPYLLNPADGFHRLLSRSMDGLSSSRERTRPPYGPLSLDNSESFIITSVSGELFPGGVVVARVRGRAELTTCEGKPNYSDLRALRTPRKLPAVDAAIRAVLALAQADRGGELSVSYEDYFSLSLQVPTDQSGMPGLLARDRQSIASLLTGVPESAKLGERVVDKIYEENSSLNEKAPSELLLVNSQGIIHVLPKWNYRSPHYGRLAKVSDLAILAHFARLFLRDDTNFSMESPKFSASLRGILARWIEAPSLTMASSFANRLTWERLSESFHLRASLMHWRSGLPAEQGVGSVSVRLDGEWWLIPDVEQRIGEQRAAELDPLGFVGNPQLREFIEKDRDEASRCLASRNYRAAVVMAGAAIEGTLLAALLADQPSADHGSLLKKNLSQLIEACCPKFNQQLDRNKDTVPRRLIDQETAKFVHFTCRPWRNYVHPGLSVRSGQPANADLAKACISALELLIQDVGRGPTP